MPSNQIQEILFNGHGDMLRMDVRLESDLPCTYEITTHDCHGVFQGTVMKGNNIGGPVDSFNIPTNIGELDQRVVGWHIIFAAPKEERESTFLAAINFHQGDVGLLNSPISLSGNHSAEKIFIGFARFVNDRSAVSNVEKVYSGMRP
ncbi:MAG: hypothetical protein V7750_15260 [Sneathiella sp.]